MAKSGADKLSGLYKVQYAPREKAILSALDQKGKKAWKKKSIYTKIELIDRLEAKGSFKSKKYWK